MTTRLALAARQAAPLRLLLLAAAALALLSAAPSHALSTHTADDGSLRVDPQVAEGPEVPYRELKPEVGSKADLRQRSGISVALSADGSTAVIGGPRGEKGGAVWVFTQEPDSQYRQTQELAAPNSEGSSSTCDEHAGGEMVEGCSFGSALAISADGNTVLVGDPDASETALQGAEPLERAGAVYVFTNPGDGWSEVAKLESPDPRTGGRFGRSVALAADGETALIGATGEGRSGLAWVFSGSEKTWTPSGAPLTGLPEDPEAGFGRSVALSGNGELAVVGAPNEEGHSGAAWVFEGAAPGELPEHGTKLVGGEQQEGAQFGYSVAVSSEGGTLLVGAPGFEANGGPESTGAAWAFERSGSEWSEQRPKLVGPGERIEAFGASVALSASGQTAVVGAPRGLEGGGDAWVYEHSATGWGSAARELVPRAEEPGQADAEQGRGSFGASIASSANAETLLVGAPANAAHEGAAWIMGRGPAITGITPSSGTPNGGTMVTIVGQHFSGATSVEFGEGTDAKSFKVESESEIVAESPPGVGTVQIVVTTPHGTSEAVAADEFTYGAPLITDVSPESGPRTGGTAVTIRGEYFTHVTAVQFGGNEASSWKVESEGVITAVSPAGEAGTVEVAVQAAAGVSAHTRTDRFTYDGSATVGGKHEHNEEEPTTTTSSGNPSNNSQSGTSSGSSGGSSAGGVLAAGPVAVDTCHAALLSGKVLVQRSRLALFKLAGKGVGSCHGKLTLRVRVKTRGRRSALKTIGTAVFSIVAGKRVTVKATLTHAGRVLLAADHGRLKANLLITRSSPLPVLAQTATVHLAPQPAARKRKT
ncbi:MAG TPA: IPT/TIG domain-containing protein [Solirubrobacteraceae bacterium]|nr:IPT/TIG domain-containing protein [Solirubrobacteraceae bacterium]